MASLCRHFIIKSLPLFNIKVQRCISLNAIGHCHQQKNIMPLKDQNVFDTRTEREKIIHTKFMELMDRYEELTGLKEVRVYQDRVIKAQDELLKIQEHRRRLNEELAQLTIKRNELQTRFHSLSRDDPQWFSTISEENRLLLEERKVRNSLTNVERDERDFFTYMSNAVRDSHEKQRWQSDRTKYWSLILTIISSFLTYLISNWRHKRIVHELIENKNRVEFPENIELQKLISVLNDGTKKLQNVSTTNAITKEAVNSLDKKLSTAIVIDNEIKTELNKINKILSYNHAETKQIINDNKQINFLGEGNEHYEDIHAVHGPSFGLGILCTFGVITLIKIMFSNR